MKWVTIARKDFQDARRSRMLWGATGLFLLVVCGILLIDPPEGGTATDAMATMIGVSVFFVPIVVIVMSYLSITGERESGSIKYLLGLPVERRDVLVGKFVGRSAVAGLAVSIAFVCGAVVLGYQFDTFPLVEYTQFVLLSLFFVIVWVGISVGISAMSHTRGQALAGTLGPYFLFSIVWMLFDPQNGVRYFVEDLLGLNSMPQLYDFVLHISPSFTYLIAHNSFIDGGRAGDRYLGQYGGEYPFYLADWFMIVILLVWATVPLAVGYLRFRNAELG